MSLFLVALLGVISFAGCGGGQSSSRPSSSSDTITVVDMADRNVEITKNVESVATLYGILTSYVTALGKADKLVAAPFTSDFFKMVHPVFETIGTVGRGQVDMEALARFNPDLFFHRASDISTLEAVQEMGIPAVGVFAETPEDITVLLSLLGKVLGAEDRAVELATYYGQMIDKAKAISKDIPPEKRKSAIVMGSQLGTVANGSMLQSFMIETAGGTNSASEVSSIEIWPVVGTETIFAWNPDFIFITNNSSARYGPQTLMADPAWANLTAVKEKQVYLVPSDKDSWEFPGISSALGSLWMLSAMYPDRFSREQLDAEAKEFYKKVYNLDVTPELMGY